MGKDIVFTREIDTLRITAKSPDGGCIESQSVEALLLYGILEELKKT